MLELSTLAWLVAGLLAGCLHAAMLWRAARQLTRWTPVLGMLRLGVVTGVLVVAALAGAIFAAASGWAAGFAVLGAWFVARRRGTAVASSSGPFSE